ncbi:MFS transporter [Phaeacidiphilus oryzae]|uniref:MFS transporter n=1 Tax=Phaeacidiphilus oryzae TaxID=348818 RepID=UPI0007C70D70|nr:MFS transporter [Phaeacidiphilus oryzae]
MTGSDPAGPRDIGRRRWLMLALGLASQAAACVFIYGVPYLVPELRAAERLSLAQSGTVVAAPTVGLVVALIAWGAAADRYGERVVLTAGLGLATAALLAGLAVHGAVLLWVVFFLAGAAGACVSAASGRVVMGWFSARERGLAMGIRQTATPLGMGVAAVAVPPLAAGHGVHGALLFTAVLTAAVTVAVGLWVVDPPRAAERGRAAEAPRPASPYRSTPALWRIHGSSALLVWPQFTVSAFGLVYLVDVEHWDAAGAGRLMAVGQLLGALGRIAVGRWSDRVGSRLRPIRRLAVANAVLMAGLAVSGLGPSWLSIGLLVAACGLTAGTNGLAFTSTAELAGPEWAGRALGVQNTGQNLTASLTPPLAGELIGAAGYPPAFALAAVFAAAAAFVTPSDRGLRPGYGRVSCQETPKRSFTQPNLRLKP